MCKNNKILPLLAYGEKVPRKTAQIKPVHAPGHARRAAQTAAGQPRPAAREGLCRRLRGRGFLARHLRPLPEPLHAFRNLGSQPRRPAQGQEGADGHDPPLVGRTDPVRRLGFRLPVRRPYGAVARGQQRPLHVPHLRLRHRELPLLRPLAAQHLRQGHQKRYPHLRFRAFHA